MNSATPSYNRDGGLRCAVGPDQAIQLQLPDKIIAHANQVLGL
jgi:hypothetical protein